MEGVSLVPVAVRTTSTSKMHERSGADSGPGSEAGSTV